MNASVCVNCSVKQIVNSLPSVVRKKINGKYLEMAFGSSKCSRVQCFLDKENGSLATTCPVPCYLNFF